MTARAFRIFRRRNDAFFFGRILFLSVFFLSVFCPEVFSLPAREEVIRQALNQAEREAAAAETDVTPPDPVPAPYFSSELSKKDLSKKQDNSGRSQSRPKPDRAQVIKESLDAVEMGWEGFHYVYKEPGLMQDKGYLHGVFASYTKRIDLNEQMKIWGDAFPDGEKISMFRLEGRVNWGEVDYSSESTGTLDGISYWTAEARGLLGYDFSLRNDWRLTPFLGFGYRYLRDDGGERRSSTGNWSYDRDSRYYYIPVGIELTKRLRQAWQFVVTLEYDIFIYGRQVSHMEDGGLLYFGNGIYDTYDPLVNEQEEGYGLRGSFKIIRSHENWDFVFEPFFRYWNIEESLSAQLTSGSGSKLWYYADTSPYTPALGWEPHNKTTECGLKIGLRY